MTLEGTINPMRQFPAYREIHGQPLEQRIAALRDPAFRARVLAEEPILPRNRDAVKMITDFPHIYPMDAALSYEPGPDDSLAAIAARKGCSPVEVMMDAMADGVPLLVLFGNYPGDLESQRRAIEHPQSVFGLSDGGAHCGVLVDASVPTYMLTYFTRDRVRGPRMPLEFVVHKMTQDTARVYGLHDRGVLAPGYKADFNLIDFERLRLFKPEVIYDLPAGGRRMVQRAEGYRHTFVSGTEVMRDGEPTGPLPGRLVRGARPAP
jgi:N-acyl-D-aspartate/D-glutamate deacylase